MGDGVIDLANASSVVGVPLELVNQLSSFIIFLQAVGGILVLYLIFNIINAFFSRRKQKEFEKMNKNLEEIKELLQKQQKKK